MLCIFPESFPLKFLFLIIFILVCDASHANQKKCTHLLTVAEGYRLWAGHFDSGHKDNLMFLSEEAALTEIRQTAVERLTSKSAALDLGSGTGRAIAFLESQFQDVVAIDVSPEMLAIAKLKAKKTEFIEGDFLKFQFGRQFDFIHSALVLKHFENLPTFFAKVHSLLKPGGTFYISEISDEIMKTGSRPTVKGTELIIESTIHNFEDVREAVRSNQLQLTSAGYVPFVESLLEANPRWAHFTGRNVQYYFVGRRE